MVCKFLGKYGRSRSILNLFKRIQVGHQLLNTEATANMLTEKNSDEAESEQKLLITQALDFCHGEQEDYPIVMCG